MSFFKLKKYIFYAFLLSLWLPSLVWGADIRGKLTDFPPAAIDCGYYNDSTENYDENLNAAGGDECSVSYCLTYAEQLDDYKRSYQECTKDMKKEFNSSLKLIFDTEQKILKNCYLIEKKFKEIDDENNDADGDFDRFNQLMDDLDELLMDEKDLEESIDASYNKTSDLFYSCSENKKKPKNPLDFLSYLDSGGNSGDLSSDEDSSSWLGDMASAFFSWDSTSWDDMKQQAVDYWQAQSQATDGPLQYFYDLMGLLADQGSRSGLLLAALSIIPFASLTKLFALNNLGPKLTLDIINSNLSNIPVIFKNLPSGLSGVAGIGNGVKYTQAGSVAIKSALANNPISGVIIKHEVAHLMGASEIGAYNITNQAFSALSLGDKFRSLGSISGIDTAFRWTLEKTLPTLNKTITQLGYAFNRNLTRNIWKGY